MAPEKFAAFTRKAISPWCRSFANGCRHLPAWAPARSWPNLPEATDHVFLSRLGLPAFQFIQDPLDYETRVHHTDLDTFDHLRPLDLRQASVVLATVLMAAANSEKPLPRKVLPTQPAPTDPFAYPDPSEEQCRGARNAGQAPRPASAARGENQR